MAKRRREQIRQKSRAKSRQQIYIIGGIVVVGLIAVIAATQFLGRQVSLPDGVDTAYADVEQGFTEAGFPRLGSGDAPILVEDFSSFGCPHCEDLHEDQLKNLVDEAREGHVQIVFVPVISIGGDYAADAARAAMCAGEQGKFWEMNDILFHWRSRYSINDYRLETAAEEIGIDADELKDCYDSDRYEDLLRRSQGEFQSRGLSATPIVFVNGQRLENAFGVGSEVASRMEQLGLGG